MRFDEAAATWDESPARHERSRALAGELIPIIQNHELKTGRKKVSPFSDGGQESVALLADRVSRKQLPGPKDIINACHRKGYWDFPAEEKEKLGIIEKEMQWIAE